MTCSRCLAALPAVPRPLPPRALERVPWPVKHRRRAQLHRLVVEAMDHHLGLCDLRRVPATAEVMP